MGTEIIPYLIWLFGASGILIVVLRMLMARRFLAAAVAGAFSLAAYLPFFFIIGWRTIDILQAELALALVFGVPALAYSRRWHVLTVFLLTAFVPASAIMLSGIDFRSEGAILATLTVPIFIWSFTTLSAPVVVALASVFFVGAFIERRPYRSGLCCAC
jgi:hypothetical protein